MMTQPSSRESSPRMKPLHVKFEDAAEMDSGYCSASSSTASLPQVSFTPSHLRHINDQLEKMQAMDILRFCRVLFPNLYQTTAFGLTGLVTLDMLSKMEKESSFLPSVELIFLDTLYHFDETYQLVERVKERYSNVKMHVYKPADCGTVADFETKYGEKLYETSAEFYDWVAKVEPQQRAYSDLNVGAVLTGRRRSQGGQRNKIPIVEVDNETGIVKINPLVNWSFQDVQKYIKENDVPYNVLLDRGYKSVGDWHSTSPVAEGEDERAGRWKGQNKTECGIHNKKSRYAQFLEEADRKAAEAAKAAKAATAAAMQDSPVGSEIADDARWHAARRPGARRRQHHHQDHVPSAVTSSA
ncbi:phosphoadenosine phosphosulfate reductase [Pyricularia oryzae 70-15]|uniref:phosphoadenylyl-sulfate reductase (thioredoxin) n=3 Tax=Pyricularia oryzae TaxID=318829 RepID=G4N6T9_PYRO7|nr:phosphoadenosine phosphosulfate reductase [Pyricularia oryzae 70-15]EHA49906.1 phosphoadenosine phosphosulfate reductase [Pyricularia oryzae 70-15]